MMIDDFLNYLRYERNRSELTVRNYEKSLRDFESYFKNRESHLSWESVDSDVIRDWMESMMDKGDMASTVNNSLSAVRSFFRFALARGLVASDPAHAVKGPKKQKPLPQFVREAEMDRLIDVPQMWGDSYADLRARTIIILCRVSGAERPGCRLRVAPAEGHGKAEQAAYHSLWRRTRDGAARVYATA